LKHEAAGLRKETPNVLTNRECAIRAARLNDPGHAAAEKLREFIDWKIRPAAAVVKKALKAHALSAEHGLILNADFRRP
jgi:hypothetical protein